MCIRDSVRAVLISGGQGGLTGEKGEDGKQSNQGGTGGAGGKGGEGGNGGRILQSTLNVNPGDTFAVSIGTGGAAGVNGTDTTFGSLSTASGASSPNGFTDPFTEVTYAAKGENLSLIHIFHTFKYLLNYSLRQFRG